MRLAAAEEAADPGRRLLRLALVGDVGLENPGEPAPVLALADEVLQLEAQNAAIALLAGVGHGRDAVVRQRDLMRIALVDVLVLHAS